MLAYDYPLIGAFWTTFVLALFVILLYLLFRIFADIFRSPDMGGFAKVLWIILVIVVPVLGILAYVLWRGHAMSQRDVKAARAKRLERNAAGGPTSTSWYDL
jgi:protein-S-isoprenylcysteine O-methyltransferase Ste14